MFAGALANFGNDGAGRIVRDQDAIAHAGRKRFRKDEVLDAAAERASHFQSIVVGFAAEDGSVDGFEEGAHRIVFGHEEKIDGAVGAGDVAVETDAEAEDDFADFARGAVRGVLFRRLLYCLLRGHDEYLPMLQAQLGMAVPQKRLFQREVSGGDVGIERVFAGAGFVE